MVLLVLLPESIEAIVHDIFEVSVRLGGSLEGRMARVHGEQDHSKRENVSSLTNVWLLGVDFRSHITISADSRSAESCSSTSVYAACESKVSNFDVIICVEENIFRLKVSVREAF